VSLCRAYSALTIRSNVPGLHSRNPRAPFWGKALEAHGSFSMPCYMHCVHVLRRALRGCARHRRDQLQPGLGPPASTSQNFCNGEPPPAPVAGMVMVCSFSAPSVMTMPLGTMSEG